MTYSCPFRQYIENDLAICNYRKDCEDKRGDKYLWICAKKEPLGIGATDSERLNAISKLEEV